tara:strand:+ start:78 stop:629 length:552 start_codon:yes stop_codon:yes gene_type:complete
MNEAWYEIQGPSREEVINTIYQCWFIRNLRSTTNEYVANKILHQKLVNYYNKKNNITLKNFNFNPNGESNIPTLKLKYVKITFEQIKLHPNVIIIVSKIIDEEISKIEKNDGFGSYRGFQTFVKGTLEENIINRVIEEIWCVVIIKKEMNKLVKKWIKNRYAPGGKGYFEAKKRFENNNYITI